MLFWYVILISISSIFFEIIMIMNNLFLKHDDNENKGKYCFVFFVNENERNSFITGLKEAWELLFQVI